MKPYLKAGGVIVGAHLVRSICEHIYYKQCTGLLISVFAWGSPMCKGLRWVTDTSTDKIFRAVQGLVAVFI
jgi:hypothetical protein